jgi:hypothetical protein
MYTNFWLKILKEETIWEYSYFFSETGLKKKEGWIQMAMEVLSTP